MLAVCFRSNVSLFVFVRMLAVCFCSNVSRCFSFKCDVINKENYITSSKILNEKKVCKLELNYLDHI